MCEEEESLVHYSGQEKRGQVQVLGKHGRGNVNVKRQGQMSTSTPRVPRD